MALSRMEIVDSEESKNVAVVHKTNQGYSGKDLYKLKQEQPHLFGGAAAPEATPSAPSKKMCRDPETGEMCEVNVGQDLTKTFCLRGDASSTAGANGTTSKHVVINDLRRAGEAMKLDLTHHDHPSAMFAVFDTQVNGAAITDAAARGLHMHLLRRLASFRGRWQNTRLESMVAESLESLALEIGAAEQGIAVALALVLGERVVLGASRGTKCMVFCGSGGDDGSINNVEIIGEGPTPSTHCVVLDDGHLGALLVVEGFKAAGFSTTKLRNVVRPHISGERPRAACITLLKAAKETKPPGPLAMAALFFGWANTDGPAAKRLKAAPAASVPKVRCRHLLIRHVGCQAPAGTRRAKPATRSLAEAEQLLLDVLCGLAWGGRDLPGAFTAKVKELSECDTALRGADLAGDLGWLDRDPKKNKKVPAALVRAAFTLAVGQLSDIIATEQGVHLAVRIA
mmetsp:Transcript_22863/g.53492  ORF Transcript_22863/g.53492 Transcript_22863/m.53492 type:complete len:455 (-) Transcript_22863:16-1380(-)